MIKVSVIVPVYNVELYIEKCLNSLYKQTMKELEFIIVNDGTKDNSQDIIDKFVSKDKRFKSFIKENGGLSDARNFGIEKSNGEYITFLDSDDWFEIDFCEKVYNEAVMTNSDLVFTNIRVSYSNGETFDVNSGEGFLKDKQLNEQKQLLFNIAPQAWGKLYKRELFTTTNIRYPKGLYYEDIATTFCVMLNSCKISKVDEPLINYFVDRPDNITSVYDERAMHIFKVLEINNNYFQEKERFLEFYEEVEYLNLKYIFDYARTLRRKADKSIKEKYINYIYVHLDKYFSNWRNNKYLSNKISSLSFKERMLWFISFNKLLMKIYMNK